MQSPIRSRQHLRDRILTVIGISVLALAVPYCIVVGWIAYGFYLTSGLHIGPQASGTIIGQNCGEVHFQMRSTPTPIANSATTCLWTAYQQCTAATAIYTETLVDVAWRHFVTVRPQSGHCTVQDAVESHSYNNKTQSVTLYHCTSLYQSSAGLVAAGCGDEGDVTFP